MASAFGGQRSIQLSYGCLGADIGETGRGRKCFPAPSYSGFTAWASMVISGII
ncbi:hypothetical protein Ga0609869_002217 [Rhodovulum iodosum]|uniref:Uncharacterized protein n=1 Tax=Rhodovulum iodosum TaxID=68291 RepID=A0ABV3XU52_9RHOB